jgi:hypothetical protein
VLLGIGSYYLAQASVDGSYFGDIFLGLLICGPGVGLTFVTCSIAALAGIAEREAGLASGLSNTTFQIGAAVGTAIVSTVAFSRTTDVVAAGGGDVNPVFALTEGIQAGFLACVVLAAVGLLVAVGLLSRPRGPAPESTPVEAVAADR